MRAERPAVGPGPPGNCRIEWQERSEMGVDGKCQYRGGAHMIGKLLAGLRRLEEVPVSSQPARRAEPEGVLIITDNADDLRALSLALVNERYRLETANNAVLAKWKLSGASYGLILL